MPAKKRPGDDAIVAAFGERLRVVRLSRGLSQDQLGELIGVQDKHISNLERAAIQPTLTTIVRLLTALSAEPNELLGGLQSPGVGQAEL